MPKNVLFSLKNCKNRQKTGADPLASGGWGIRPQTPTSVIQQCKFFSLHLPTKHKHRLFRNQLNDLLFLELLYSGNAPGFRRRKIMLHFVCHRLRKL